MAHPNGMPPAGQVPRPFSIPIFRMVWIASMLSNFGGIIQSVGASWMMTSLTPSPTMVALVQSSTTLPIMLLSLWAGAIADNLDRRKLMLVAQSFMLVISIGLSIAAWTNVLTPWLLLGFTFLIGCGTALNAPAWQASVGDMVPRAALPGAVALNSMAFNIARSVGPAIGGAIIAAAGAATAFLVNALSYSGLIFVLSRWRPQLPAQQLPRETIGVAMAAGLRYVAMSPGIKVVLLRAILFGSAASAVSALMPLVARDHIGGGPLTYGLLLGGFGLGAVTGAFASGRLRQRWTSEQLVRTATLALAAGVAVTAVSNMLFVTMIALMAAGAGWVLALSTFNVTVQLATPRWVVARSVALYQTAAFGAMALGSWLFGELAAARGVETALLVAAGWQTLGVLLTLRLPLPRVEALNLDPLQRWSEPDLAVSIEPRSGPIAISVEYRIAKSDISAFLNEMHARRRMRVRDGARHWTLLRDLSDPELWVERYHVPTWLDYVRHNQRRTHEDAEHMDRVHALHRGPDRPRVSRLIERQTGSLPITEAAGAREMAEPMTDATRSS